jgi:hypothetical protein
MLLPGHKVTQEASFSWLENHKWGAGPISPSHAQHTTSPKPGTVLSRSASRSLARDPLVEVIDRGAEAGDAVAVQPAQQRVMLGEPPGQRLGQAGQLAARQGQRAEHAGAGPPHAAGAGRAHRQAGAFLS